MRKSYNKAFMLGKFLPFHKGHEAMAHFALQHCNQLSILICSSNLESISGEERYSWIKSCFSRIPEVEIQIFNYNEKDLVNSSNSSRVVSKRWAQALKNIFPKHDLIVSSEPYGEYVATYMNIKHLLFDQARGIVDISATKIRSDLLGNWNFLPNPVKPFFQKKIVLLGTESVGKSSLAADLAAFFNASLVEEVGRSLIEDSNNFGLQDLYKVADYHAQSIGQKMLENKAVVFIDTDIHITQSYAHFFFGKQLKLSPNIYEVNQAHLYLYLNNDVPHIQDGSRLDENTRNKLDLSHRAILKAYKIPYLEIMGNWEERFKQSILQVQHLFKNTFPPNSK